MSKPKKGRVEKHNKWGYIFLIPFILTYVIFQLSHLSARFIIVFSKIIAWA